MTIERKARGCLLGLACGDALGRPVEFRSAEEIASQHGEVTEMLGHGTHGQPPGTITDYTEMALCIAESLVDRRGFESLRRVAFRHPEIEYERWAASSGTSGGR